MKIRSILISGLLMMALAGCESTSSGGGGGLFGGGGGFSADADHWDLMLMPQSAACPDGFSGRGAAVNPALPGGYFPGVKVINSSSMYSGKIPEVKILAYLATIPVIEPGSPVRIRFNYKALSDGEDGDYFLVRILDGGRFRVPVYLSGEEMTSGEWRGADFFYKSKSDSFGIEFIVGLSSPSDSLLLDNLEVKVNGDAMITDVFEWGDYTAPRPLLVAPALLVYPFLPTEMKGTIGLTFDDRFEGEGSLLFTGGSYFVLDGFGGSFGDFSGVQLSMYDETMALPFHGDFQALKQGASYVGYFDSETSDPNAVCTEFGNVVVSIGPDGNADLSGSWTLQMLVECEEEGLGIASPEGGPAYFGSTTVSPMLLYFTGTPFATAFGDNIASMLGLSLGDAGFMMLGSTLGTTAVLQGIYDEGSGIFAGQVSGTLPVGGMTCTVKQGQFMALIGPAIVPVAK